MYGFEINQLANLLKQSDPNRDDSDSDDDQILKKNPTAHLTPASFVSQTQTTAKTIENVNAETPKKTSTVNSKDIWQIDEVPDNNVQLQDQVDKRPQPEYEMHYKQRVTTEDVFLQMGNKNPSSASCEDLVVSYFEKFILYLNQLQILQLQYNEIQSIGSGLVYLTRLQSLRIDSNKLSVIRSDEVLKLAQLKTLDISDCSIENVEFINTLSSITELRACHCYLKTLPNQFRNLRYLIDLDLSNNELINITPLKSLSSLRVLHLANNHIQDIQILSSLVHLNELDLNNNQINLIPNTFDKLIDLQYLNLSNNRINSWDDIVRFL
ncbi:unnamed protein product [Rotaria sp. Silwood1]|nr:unnamed protein product [Rotaria sp. Silwood1]